MIYPLPSFSQLGKKRNDLLWLACVGLTEHLLLEHIDRAAYEECAARLRHYVRHANVDRLDVSEDFCVAAAGPFGWIGVQEQEPRFVAHRHWNVRDAMYYSDYVSTRLRDKDPDSSWESVTVNLDRLLALTGVPLKQCKQSFQHMGEDEKKQVGEGITVVLREGAENCFGGSFGAWGGCLFLFLPSSNVLVPLILYVPTRSCSKCCTP